MATSIKKIELAFPKISEWTGFAFSALPSTGTEVTDVDYIDLGTVSAAVAGEEDARGATIEYNADFDDSNYDDAKIWAWNLPNDLKIDIFADMNLAANATWGAAIATDDPIGGAKLEGSPFDILATHKVAAADYYSAANKRTGEILLQLANNNTGSALYSQVSSPHGAPVAVVEMPRTAYGSTNLDETKFSMDVETGHLFTFSDVKLLVKNSIGRYQWIGAIKEDSMNVQMAEEHIMWDKSKPMATYHVARSQVNGGFTFKVDEFSPAFLAKAYQTNATRSASDRTVDVSINAQSPLVREAEYMFEWQTQGGYIVRAEIPRGVMRVTGDYQPGASEFAGLEFEVKALNTNVLTTRDLINYRVTDTPVEQVLIPLLYGVVA